MHNATFYDHAVKDDGLYIRGMIKSGHNQGQMVEIFVDRETAESFGWIDSPEEEVEGDDENEYYQRKEREGQWQQALRESAAFEQGLFNEGLL